MQMASAVACNRSKDVRSYIRLQNELGQLAGDLAHRPLRQHEVAECLQVKRFTYSTFLENASGASRTRLYLSVK